MKIRPRKKKLKTGETVLLCSPTPEDAQGCADHANKVFGETNYLSWGANEREPLKAENEIDWIESYSNSERNFIITAKLDEKIVGIGSINVTSNKPRLKHRGNLAISVQKEHWHKGIGNEIMSLMVETARKLGYEQIELEVFKDNVPARSLYKKQGFVEVGDIPNAVKLSDETYVNLIYMVKEL